MPLPKGLISVFHVMSKFCPYDDTSSTYDHAREPLDIAGLIERINDLARDRNVAVSEMKLLDARSLPRFWLLPSRPTLARANHDHIPFQWHCVRIPSLRPLAPRCCVSLPPSTQLRLRPSPSPRHTFAHASYPACTPLFLTPMQPTPTPRLVAVQAIIFVSSDPEDA